VLCALLPLISNSYNRIDHWCFIDDSTQMGMIWIWTLSYAPAWIIIIVITLLYIAIIGTVIDERRRQKLRNGHTSHIHAMKLIGYPTVFILMWVFITIYRIYEQATRNGDRNIDILFAFEIMLRLALRSQGTLNVIIFMFTSPLEASGPIIACFKICLTGCGLIPESKSKSIEEESDVESEWDSLIENDAYQKFMVRRSTPQVNYTGYASSEYLSTK
jgi:heme/copper-type cytochrome/quinol oxidase subunit 2